VDYERYHEETHLKIEIADRIAIATLDRPDERNAIDCKMVGAADAATRCSPRTRFIM
jgi:enoyl-CoA hydratase/carnithine racemase